MRPEILQVIVRVSMSRLRWLSHYFIEYPIRQLSFILFKNLPFTLYLHYFLAILPGRQYTHRPSPRGATLQHAEDYSSIDFPLLCTACSFQHCTALLLHQTIKQTVKNETRYVLLYYVTICNVFRMGRQEGTHVHLQ